MTERRPLSAADLHAALAKIDTVVAQHILHTTPDDAKTVSEAWTRVRYELRVRRSQSERMLPAIGSAAQHFVQAREEIDRGIEQLSSGASAVDESATDPSKRGR